MTPDKSDPVAWLAFATDGSESSAVYATDGEAQAAARDWGWSVAPLFLGVTDADKSEPDWRAAYQRACQEATLALSGKVAAEARARRLRLTDAEREAIKVAINDYELNDMDAGCWHIANTLRGLLERLSDRTQSTPQPQSTPSECTVPPEWTLRPYYVDPPSGHRYGFPRLYDPAQDGDMTEWMIANGYPEQLARQGLACTFTACTDSGEK